VGSDFNIQLLSLGYKYAINSRYQRSVRTIHNLYHKAPNPDRRPNLSDWCSSNPPHRFYRQSLGY
jgi:hypothetical protein